MTIAIEIKSGDVIDSDKFTKIEIDKENETMSFISTDKEKAAELKRFLITYRNMENMANDDVTLYNFKVSTSQINMSYIVIVSGNLSEAVCLMNKIEIDTNKKILSDTATSSVNDILSEPQHQIEKHGDFFSPLLIQSGEAPHPSELPTKEELESKAEKLAEQIKLFSEGLSDGDRARLVEMALKKSDTHLSQPFLGGFPNIPVK